MSQIVGERNPFECVIRNTNSEVNLISGETVTLKQPYSKSDTCLFFFFHARPSLGLTQNSVGGVRETEFGASCEVCR